MVAIIIDALPTEVQKLHTELETAVGGYRDLKSRGREAAAAEPIAARALEAARAARDEAEVDFALATDESEKTLRGALDQKRREFQEAEEALRRVQLLGRGILSRTASAADAILAAKAAFDAGCVPFCEETLAAYRQLLNGSLSRSEGGLPFVRVLRLGYAVLDALPFIGALLRPMLDGVNIPDIGPAPGRPVPRFIQGDRAWFDDHDLAGASLRHWQDDVEIATLHSLLKPLGATYAEAVTHIRRIEQEGPRTPPPPQPSAPPHLEPHPSSQPQPTAEEHRALMREESAARAEKNRRYPPLGPRATYHGSRFANDSLA